MTVQSPLPPTNGVYVSAMRVSGLRSYLFAGFAQDNALAYRIIV